MQTNITDCSECERSLAQKMVRSTLVTLHNVLGKAACLSEKQSHRYWGIEYKGQDPRLMGAVIGEHSTYAYITGSKVTKGYTLEGTL